MTYTRRGEFFAGMWAIFPLLVGAVPFGIIYGAVAVTGGLSPAATLGMSLFVFAGSSQFIAAGLVVQGAALPVIVVTTFVVNLRHMLYAASLAPYVRGLSQRWLLPLGFWLTDEAYAVTISRYQRADKSPYKHWFYFGAALIMYLNWQAVTVIGIVAGQNIGDAANWGLDFAMIVTFIGLVVPLVVNHPMLLCAVTAGVVAVLANGLPNNLGLMVGAAAGIAVGYWAETQKVKSVTVEQTV